MASQNINSKQTTAVNRQHSGLLANATQDARRSNTARLDPILNTIPGRWRERENAHAFCFSIQTSRTADAE